MILSIALRNIRKHWRKSFATVLAISSSFMAQTLFIGYNERVKDIFYGQFSQKQMYADLIIENKNRMTPAGKDEPLLFSMDPASDQAIQKWVTENTDSIEAYVRFLHFSGTITNGKSQLVVAGRGYDLQESEKIRGPFSWNAKYGVPLEKEPKRGQALLGVQLGKWLQCSPTPEREMFIDIRGYPAEIRPFQCATHQMQITALTETNQINALTIQSIGLVDGGVREIDSRLVLTDLESVQSLLNTKKISYGTLRWKPSADKQEMTKKLDHFLRQLNPDFIAVPWEKHEYGKLYEQSISLLDVFKSFIVLIVLIITGFSVFNTCVKSILERIKEIGTLLCLGFSKETVEKLFVAETFFLAALGNFLGLVGVLIVATLINQMKVPYKAGIYSEAALLYIKFIPLTYLTAALVTTGTSLVTTYLTTRSFLKRRIIQNLNG